MADRTVEQHEKQQHDKDKDKDDKAATPRAEETPPERVRCTLCNTVHLRQIDEVAHTITVLTPPCQCEARFWKVEPATT